MHLLYNGLHIGRSRSSKVVDFGTNQNQFGFKKNIGCNHAIYSVRKIVDRAMKEGSTVNLCTIDLSKAFDKVNHQALYIKLMRRRVPVELLELLENWLSNCMTCVKWHDVFSSVWFNLRC